MEPPLQSRAGGKGPLQDGGKLHLLTSTGLHGPIRNNVDFVPIEDDFGRSTEFAVFPVGQQVALYRLDDGCTKFLSRVSKQESGILVICCGFVDMRLAIRIIL